MALATTLRQAANLSYSQMKIWWESDALVARIQQFWNPVLNTTFPDANEKSRPVANWLTLLSSFQQEMATDTTAPSDTPIVNYVEAVFMVYRCCWLAQLLPLTQVTAAQKTELLAAWNTAFGT